MMAKSNEQKLGPHWFQGEAETISDTASTLFVIPKISLFVNLLQLWGLGEWLSLVYKNM